MRYAKLWDTFSLSDFQLEYDVGRRLEGSRIGAQALSEELRINQRTLRAAATTRRYLAIRWLNWQYILARTSECEQLVDDLSRHANAIRGERPKLLAAQKAYEVASAARPICRELREIEVTFAMDMFQKILQADTELEACRRQHQ
jgi:hypothetical protein